MSVTADIIPTKTRKPRTDLKVRKNASGLKPKYNYKVDKEIALLRAIQGVSQADIAREFKVSESAISLLLKPYRDKINAYLVFKDDKSSAMEFRQYLMTENLKDSVIQKMNGRDTTVCIGILNDKIRDERGQSSGQGINVGINISIEERSQLERIAVSISDDYVKDSTRQWIPAQ